MTIYRATATATWSGVSAGMEPRGTIVGLVDAANLGEAMHNISENLAAFDRIEHTSDDVVGSPPLRVAPFAPVHEFVYLHIEKVSDKAFLARVAARRKAKVSTEAPTYDHWVFRPSWQP